MGNGTQHPNESSPSGHEAEGGAPWPRLALPGAAVVVTLGLFGYAIASGSAGDQAPIRPHSSAPQMGDLAPQAGWIKNLSAELRLAAPQGPAASIPGLGLTAIAIPPPAVPEFVAVSITKTGPADIRLALSASAPVQEDKGRAAESRQAALNSLSVEFPANSARIPSRDRKIIQRAAAIMSALPAGMTVELYGGIAGTSVSPRGKALAQKRADAVFDALVRAGVDPAMLSKGSTGGSLQEAAANTAMEGRSSTLASKRYTSGRRVEFRVIERQ